MDNIPTPDDLSLDVIVKFSKILIDRQNLLEALKNAVERMEENHPPKAKKGDLDAVFNGAIFYRDLQAARAAIAKAESIRP